MATWQRRELKALAPRLLATAFGVGLVLVGLAALRPDPPPPLPSDAPEVRVAVPPLVAATLDGADEGLLDALVAELSGAVTERRVFSTEELRLAVALQAVLVDDMSSVSPSQRADALLALTRVADRADDWLAEQPWERSDLALLAGGLGERLGEPIEGRGAFVIEGDGLIAYRDLIGGPLGFWPGDLDSGTRGVAARPDSLPPLGRISAFGHPFLRTFTADDGSTITTRTHVDCLAREAERVVDGRRLLLAPPWGDLLSEPAARAAAANRRDHEVTSTEALGWLRDGRMALLVQTWACPAGEPVPDDRSGVYAVGADDEFELLFPVYGRRVVLVDG